MAKDGSDAPGLIAKTKRSLAYAERARRSLPGAVTANVKYFDPYPIAMKKARGARLWDLDGDPRRARGPGRFDRLLSATMKAASGLEHAIAEAGIAAQVPRVGTVFTPFFTDRLVRGYRDTLSADPAKRHDFDMRVLERGIFVKPGKPFYLSTAHDDASIRQTVTAFGDAVRGLG